MANRGTDGFYSSEEMELIKELLNKEYAYREVAEEVSMRLSVARTRNGIRKHVNRNRNYYDKPFKKTEKKVVSVEEKIDFEKEVEDDIIQRRLRDDKKNTDQKYKILLSRIDKVEKERDALLQLGQNFKTYSIEHDTMLKSEATAFMLASDWHIAERIDSHKVNGLNEYNLTIAKKRAETFFRNGLRLLKLQQRDVTINTLVLALLGDFISNNIHPELMESNYLLPIEEAIFVQNLLASGIEFLLEDKSLEHIIVPCHSGNHGRQTIDRRISTEAGNSLEYFIYHQIANHFRNEPRVTFLIAEGYHSYIDVYSYKVRMHHGHCIQYSGGILGLSVPVNKAVSQWDKLQRADLDCFGHYHSFLDGGKFISNGSLIGYSPFALSIKANFEPPKQAFFLIDKKRFKTIVAPILFV